ncbi:MAG: hypothetical protein ACJAUH_003105 [Saprospiraceae bacterium]|jgi:hypothetical protein
MHQIFGIRHHGPGSAKSLKKALEVYQPDVLLVEGPPDAEKAIRHIIEGDLKPPVAILTYNPKDLRQAAYFPFAEFSPEWVAMNWAAERGIPIQFMDLPQSFHFSLDAENEEDGDKQLVLDFIDETLEAGEKSEEDLLLERDPLGFLGKLAGYEDSERWWEVTFEQNENTAEIFPAIVEMMSVLRAEIKTPQKPREQMREAYMRKVLRKAIKDYTKVAVVCGAFHAPVLEDYKSFKTAADNAILKGIKRIKTETTWIPWTYERLSYSSGYGAGVLSPAWYKMLFSNRKDVVIRWMTKVAKLLRKEDLDASSAHIIEAVRLAETLAVLRGLPISGIAEMDEAAKTIFCGGYDEPMQLIREKLIIGDLMGKVSDKVPVVPLQKDLEKLIKTARLSKEYQATEAITKALDLRKDTHTIASLLLHRLNVLNIDWGKSQAIRGQKQGSFHENWRLKWKVRFPLAIIEAGMWGNTVETAATNFIRKTAFEADALSKLSELLDSAIDADLQGALPYLVQLVQDKSAVTKDVLDLMRTLPILVKKLRYGTVRKTDLSSIKLVVNQILPRIFIGLPTVCQGVDDDAAAEIFELLQSTNRSISLLDNEFYLKNWNKTLLQISDNEAINGILSGGAVRILSDRNVITVEKTGDKMAFALSLSRDISEAAQWLEGFLHGSGLLLTYQYSLWNILDGWVERLPMEKFNDILPLLRRTFSAFDVSERQKMMDLAKKGQVIEKEKAEEMVLNAERVKVVLPKLQAFFVD